VCRPLPAPTFCGSALRQSPAAHGVETVVITSKPDSKPLQPASREEPSPPSGEDSIPQDDGTDNSWQMEPFEKPEGQKDPS